MSIRWITSSLGTGSFKEIERVGDETIIDVRDLVDKAGNRAATIRQKIDLGVDALSKGSKVVVCCDYGMSRSNAIAAAILACFEKKDFDNCLRRVLQATGETEIKLEPLMAVRNALGSSLQPHGIERQSSVLLTGGNGFLGRTVQAAVAGSVKIYAPSRAELDLACGATNLDLLIGENNIDCVVHLANPRVYTSNVAMGQTLTMLRNVLDVCTTRRLRLVYLSGWEVYSGYAGRLRVDEATPLLPRGPYGETKVLAETLITHCVLTCGLQCALLRSSPVYGRGSDRPKFLWNFIEKAIRHLPVATHCYANGNPELDLLHVDDLVTAIITVVENGFVGTLNLGTGLLTSTRDIAQMVIEKLNSHSRTSQVSIDADTACIAMNWSRAARDIDWKPRITLESGIDDIISQIANEA